MEKGTYGYIDQKKKSQLIKTIIAFAIAFITLLVGYLLNDNSKKNIFTILAVLVVLPATKQLIGYILFLPFHSMKKQTYEEVNQKKKDTDFLYTDLIITSREKVMSLSFLMIKGNKIVGFCEREKENVNYISEYLQKTIEARMLPYKVKIVKDYKIFMKEIEKDSNQVVESKDFNDLKDYIKSLLA